MHKLKFPEDFDPVHPRMTGSGKIIRINKQFEFFEGHPTLPLDESNLDASNHNIGYIIDGDNVKWTKSKENDLFRIL